MEQIKEIIKEEIEKRGLKVLKIILFGSRAKEG
jgi:predicted nucleotidyltransferase